MRAYYVFWLFLMIFFFKFLPLNSRNSITSLSICELTMLTWVLSFRPDQIRLLMDIYTVYAKNPNKCFICLGAPWRFFLINSIMNFFVLNGNPMKRKQMKYFCDFEKKELSMFVFLLLNLKKPNFNAISINLIKSTCITLYSCYKSRNVSSKSLLEIQCNLWNTDFARTTNLTESD